MTLISRRCCSQTPLSIEIRGVERARASSHISTIMIINKPSLILFLTILFLLITEIKPFTNPLLSQEAGKTESIAISDLVHKAIVHTRKLPLHQPRSSVLVYVALRNKGHLLEDSWGEGLNLKSAIRDAISTAAKQIREPSRQVAEVEVCVVDSFKPIDLKKNRNELTNIHRGVIGLELKYRDELMRFAPSWMIATNRNYDKVIEYFQKKLKLTKNQLHGKEVIARTFGADQFLVLLTPQVKIFPMFRGNTLVSPNKVTKENVQALAELMKTWMVTNVKADGEMTYKYWPSRGRYSTSNNMVRQFMATVCFGRMTQFYEDEEIAKISKQNLQYNLDHFYTKEGDYGYIIFDNKAKLGAASLAALAIVESSFRSEFREYEEGLSRFIDRMSRENGAFQTFYMPATRTDGHNFYPGETQLFRARLYSMTKNDKLLREFMKSFEFYRAWHFENRNPAFVPWHTQACYLIWTFTKDEELKEFIFETNDWLIETMQQWDNTIYKDTKGRFYSPRKAYGPPHASSTGVYLEGLIDAFLLAKETGDIERTNTYRTAINRGLRSIMQLQFADEIDLYYVSKRKRVEGAIRTTVYNNEIRVDNVQHNLMALFKILHHFEDDDYTIIEKNVRKSDTFLNSF